MQMITFPLRINMKRDEVSHLHKALETLGFRVDHSEKKDKRFGRITRQAVLEFQEKYHLEPTGEVDEKTANRFNALLKRPEKSKKQLFFDRKPDIFFKVYKDNTLVKSTEDSVLWNVSAGDKEIIIHVERKWPIQFIRFGINAFKVKTNEGQELDRVSKNKIKDRRKY